MSRSDPSESFLIPRNWPPRSQPVVSAHGCRLRTRDGRELFDATSGALATSLGYGPEPVVRAVGEQLRRLPFAHSGKWTSDVAETAAERLAAVLPGDGDDALRRVMFVPGGSDAVELAIELAYRIQTGRGEPERSVVLARHLSYHGCTRATLEIGARQTLRGLAGLGAGTFPHVPPPYPYRPEWRRRFPCDVAGVAGIEAAAGRSLRADEVERGRADAVAALEVAIEAIGPERICAFVAEPIVGASAGAVVPPSDYWPRVRELCDRHGVLLVADEVMAGMGRTGRWLACEHWNVLPDVVALAKGLTSGVVPGGAVVTRERWWRQVAESSPGFPLGFTFAQHPLTAAAAAATIATIEADDRNAWSLSLGTRLREELGAALGEHPHCGEIRGRGLMIGVEIVADRATREPFGREHDATGRALRAAEEAGVLFYPARGGADGVRGDAFLVAPPLVTSEADLDPVVVAACRALDAVG